METTKQCNSCNIIKSISNYTIKRSNKDGYFNICKECVTIKDLAYRRTKRGLIFKAYRAQQNRAKKKLQTLNYNKDELYKWAIDQDIFNSLYKEWENSAYNSDRCPSFSKIDNTKLYSLDNMKIARWGDIKTENPLKPKHIREEQKRKTKERVDRAVEIRSIEKEKMLKEMRERTHKACNKCGIDKDLDEYHNDKKSVDNKAGDCKACDYESGLKFVRTKEGTAYRIYKKQVQKSKLRGHEAPTYSYEELKTWLFNQEIFHKIYDEWVASGYQHLLCVSCDREDRFRGYSFDNISVTTWRDNRRRWFEERK